MPKEVPVNPDLRTVSTGDAHSAPVADVAALTAMTAPP